LIADEFAETEAVFHQTGTRVCRFKYEHVLAKIPFVKLDQNS
jgi:hypothetical protein